MLDEKLLSHLPAPSRDKIGRLIDERAGAAAVVRHRSDGVAEARDDYGRAEVWAKQARKLGPGFNEVSVETSERQRRWGETKENRIVSTRVDPAVHEARIAAELAPRKAALDRALEAHQRATDALGAFAFLDGAMAWLQRMAGTGVHLRHAPLPPVKAATATEVDRIRADIAKLDQDWRRTELAADTRDSFRQRAVAEVEALASRGAIEVNLRDRGTAPLKLAERLSASLQAFAGDADKGGTIYRLAGDTSAFLAWLHRDAILARINSLIDAAHDAGAL